MVLKHSHNLKCPYCDSENIAEYLWGTPFLSAELEEELKNNKVVLGGCCMDKHAPAYHCNTCEKDFGKSTDWR